MSIINIAGYCFFEIQEDKILALKDRYFELCDRHGLKGFMLISPEGINLSLAGKRAEIDGFLTDFRAEPGLENFVVKESASKEVPFRKLKIRPKGHIIPFSKDVRPQEGRAPVVSPKELKKWIDDGEDVVIMDVRNQYETEVGKFKKSLTLPIRYFRYFPEILEGLDPKVFEEIKDKKVVTVCTGGIKTEKATLWLKEKGFTDAYLLDGGILKYFEDCGDAHFEGRCFVFDNRVALDGQLEDPESVEQVSKDPYNDEEYDSLIAAGQGPHTLFGKN